VFEGVNAIITSFGYFDHFIAAKIGDFLETPKV
jgi:hypothetical protein